MAGDNDRGAAETGVDGGEMLAARLLEKLSASWRRRSQIRVFDPPGMEAFDPGLKDYLPELLPFHEHPAFLAAPEELRDRVLTLGWLAYSAKTIDIERGVLSPACQMILDDGLGDGIADDTAKHVTAQTMTDEAFHIVLVQHALRATRERRAMGGVVVPPTAMVANLRRAEAELDERWQRNLLLLASVITTEVFICGHLRMIADAEGLQPLNVLTTRAHLQDELRHASIFKALAEVLHARMAPRERDFFVACFAKPVQWFADDELEVWDHLLARIGFPGHRRMLDDCRHAVAPKADYSGVISMLEAMGVRNAGERLLDAA